MCIRLAKPLNPNAEEWTPNQMAPPPPPAYPVVAIASYYELMSQPFYYSQIPSASFGRKATKPIYANVEDPMLKMGLYARTLPRRLRRSIESAFSADDNKQPLKLRWRPKKFSEPGKGGGVADSHPVAPFDNQGLVPPSSANTTVMIRNVPNRLRRDEMLKFLDGYCSAYFLEYDFLYLPMDFRKKSNLGYAFVNFTTPIAANKFKKILQHFKWENVVTSRKICEISWARLQGKEVYVRKFKQVEFACDEMDFLPVVLDPPRNGSLQDPCPPLILGNIQLRRKNC